MLGEEAGDGSAQLGGLVVVAASECDRFRFPLDVADGAGDGRLISLGLVDGDEAELSISTMWVYFRLDSDPWSCPS